jgi:P-type Cu+ transporter
MTSTTTTINPTPDAATTEARLPITGMTCASCVRRVEKALEKVDGVTRASVNLATERATVAYDPSPCRHRHPFTGRHEGRVRRWRDRHR